MDLAQAPLVDKMLKGSSVSDAFVAWGKLRRNDEDVLTHPLIDHMLDVAACFGAVANHGGIRRAMHCCAQRTLGDADIARLSVLVFLHDIGKANAGFQSRRWQAPERPPGDWPTSPYGHGPEGWAIVSGSVDGLSHDVLAGLPLAEMASWAEDKTLGLLQASISHHGRPLGDEPSKQVAYVWEPVRSAQGTVLYDPAATILTMGAVLRRAFPLAFSPCAQLLPNSPAFVHLFAGLVQLVDWLGSDTRPGFFEYSTAGEDRSSTAVVRAAYAVNAIGLNVRPLRHALQANPLTFAAAFNVPGPRPMQIAAGDSAFGPVVVLEAETGSGKTEAALWRFVHLFQVGAVDSLYFALPTRVAATQLYERIRRFVVRAWPVEAPVVVRALPGYEAADGEGKISGLPPFEVLWTDKPGDEVAHRRWVAESPKRFLAATIAVGTIDQALLGALRVRHAHLRHALLSRSMLVVDEVHASDAYMTVLLEQLLKAHLTAGGQALLLSATLGAAARTRFLNIGHPHNPRPIPELNEACGLAYPAISHRAATGVELLAVAGNPQPKTVYWQTLDAIDAPDRIAALAVDAAARGARVLIVRNTVPAAVATLLAVETLNAVQSDDWLFTVDGVSTLHHSRFSRQDRPLLDKAVEVQLGKYRAAGSGRIIIGTQTLEQSLDIDADVLITDLCPMDVLLQRVGRLHRHLRPESERPDGYREARAWVLTPAGHDLAPLLKRSRNGLGRMRDGGGVYPDLRILEATRQLIEAQPSRIIPAENRALVEGATHPDALHAIEASLGEEWKKVGQAIEGDTGARRGLAHLHAIPYDQAFDSVSFPDSDQKIATRLGAADRLVEFAPPQPGPFGCAVSQLALRFHQVPAGLDRDTMPSDIAALSSRAGFEFTLGPARYRYSRLGLERLKAHDPARVPQGMPA